MTNTNQWLPNEIIVHEKVTNDPVTVNILSQCPNVPVKYVGNGRAENVVQASNTIKCAGRTMLNKIIAGKQVIFIAPAPGVVDEFKIKDDRLLCPHFERLKLASNGCFYMCDWCYLKLTFRGQRPFITVRAEYDKIKKQLKRRLRK